MRTINHVVLPSGLHALQIRKPNGVVKIEILTELEYQHLTWWNKVRLKYNF